MEPLIAKPSSSGGGMSRPPPPEPASLEAAVTEASTSEMAQIFTRVEPPFRITHVNDAWVDPAFERGGRRPHPPHTAGV